MMTFPTSAPNKLLKSFYAFLLGSHALVAGLPVAESSPSIMKRQDPSQSSVNQTQVEAIVGFMCNTERDFRSIPIDYNNCNLALGQMRQSPEYTSEKSTWDSPLPFSYRIFGSAESGCIISIGNRVPNTVGHFTLKEDVEEAFLQVQRDCARKGRGGIEFFPTDGVESIDLGWSAAFYAVSVQKTPGDIDMSLVSDTEVA